ncbi:MAG TPA: glycoside hydrolase family 5 protein [Polyangiaceae bacterium]|nr:glycoside hydrolase family 5 protein [Polyangiaceae bacterium]
MARHCFLATALLVGFSFGCDALEQNDSKKLPPVVPAGQNGVGSNHDLGAGDLGPTPVQTHGRLRVVSSELLNAAGDPVQLKGVSSMWLNWEPSGYAESPTALRWMRNNWKLSVIRAAMGIEPDNAFMTNPAKARAQVERIVDNAIEAGVYVIIDWHDHNAHKHTALAKEFFASISAKYAGVPNVIYETFNEPEQIIWETELKPYHEAMVATIRANDPEAIIVLGTPTWSQDVDLAAYSPVAGENLMYTLHFYACTHGARFRSKGDSAISQGLALFVTEWGASHSDGGRDGIVCDEEAQQWHDWMKARKISWTAWKLDDCVPDSTCLLVPGAPANGGWTDEYLRGHAPFVRGRLQEE